MYTIILDEGLVFRNSDLKTIAPCANEQDQDFVAYINWINAGNSPTIFNTRSDIPA